MQIKTKIVSCHTSDSKPVEQEVYGTVILPPLVFPAIFHIMSKRKSVFLTKRDKQRDKQTIIPGLVLNHFTNAFE